MTEIQAECTNRQIEEEVVNDTLYSEKVLRKNGALAQAKEKVPAFGGRVSAAMLTLARRIRLGAPRPMVRAYHETVHDHFHNPRNVGSLDKNDPKVPSSAYEFAPTSTASSPARPPGPRQDIAGVEVLPNLQNRYVSNLFVKILANSSSFSAVRAPIFAK